MRKMTLALLGSAAALVSAGAAEAATFAFSFTAPVMQWGQPGDTYLGSGQLDLSDTVDPTTNLFTISNVTGSVSIDGAPEYTYAIVDSMGSAFAVNGGFQLNALSLRIDGGPTSLGFINNTDGTYDIRIGEVGAPAGTFNLTSAVPEPASWALMLVGFAAIGAGLRARRRRVRVVYS